MVGLLFLVPRVAAQSADAEMALPQCVQLRQLLEGAVPAERFEIDGRIFERKDLRSRAAEAGSSVTETLVRQLLRERLVAAGKLIGDAEFERDFAEYRVKFDSTPFKTEIIATRFKGYPSLENFKLWWRLRESFARSIEKEITLKTLEAHVRRAGTMLSEARLAVEPIFFSATRGGSWDFRGALQRATKARESISEDVSFEDVAKQGDPPPGPKPAGAASAPMSLNPLRRAFGETEHSDQVMGVSAVKTFFFAPGKPGSISQPILGPTGYWIVRFGVHKEWANRNFTLEVDNRRQLARESYIDERFLGWIRAELAKVVIKRPRKPR